MIHIWFFLSVFCVCEKTMKRIICKKLPYFNSIYRVFFSSKTSSFKWNWKNKLLGKPFRPSRWMNTHTHTPSKHWRKGCLSVLPICSLIQHLYDQRCWFFFGYDDRFFLVCFSFVLTWLQSNIFWLILLVSFR